MTDSVQQKVFALHWDVHPKVVLQLGESLITDDVTALLELIKNAYDADASYCDVRIDSTATNPDRSNAIGLIEVEDDGHGMGIAELQNGWLTVANSIKAQMKADKRLTRKNRTPLGDKGLGRLGVQRLGRFVDIDTCPSGSDEGYRLQIDWDAFRTSVKLSDIPAQAKSIPKRVGTKLAIAGLNSPTLWEQAKTSQSLQRKLSQLIFPFTTERPFQVYLTLNGNEIDLAEITERVRNTANIRISYSFDGTLLTIASRYRLSALRPAEQDAVEDFARYVESDNGSSLFAYLSEHKSLASDLTYEGKDGWFVSSVVTQQFTDIATGNLRKHSPGPFRGEIDSFNLNLGKEARLFPDRGQYSEFIRSLSGIRVFRDGFGIRPYGFEGNDWLGLGQQQTSASSFYGLRPGNTVGYVQITAADNACLEEVTAREGFKETPYFESFYLLMSAVVAQIRRVTTVLRRGFNEYRGSLVNNPTLGTKAYLEIPQKMKQTAERAEVLKKSVEAAKQRVTEASSRIDKQVSSLTELSDMDPNWITPEVRNQLRNAEGLAADAKAVVAVASQLMAQINEQLAETLALADGAKVLKLKYAAIDEQLEQLTELAGLGITVEALTHEIINITKELGDRTNAAEYHVRQGKSAQVYAFIEHVRSAISSLQKQMSHVTPSLRYMRERRDSISVADFCEHLHDHYDERLKRSNIELTVLIEQDFTTQINRGRLSQVVDNLVLNSEYWLKQAIASGITTHGDIVLTVARPCIVVSDSGHGVDPIVENILFDPFVTTKPGQEGRGLGLFIARQLLEYVDCHISLLPQRNAYNRRHAFQLDLSGVIADGLEERR